MRGRGARRLQGRGFTSLVILATLLVLSLFAELYANSRPLLVFYQGAFYFPLWRTYSETTFGGNFATKPMTTILSCATG